MVQKPKHPLEDNWPLIGTKNYRGVLVIKLIGGYKVFGRVVVSPEDVDRIIDESLKVVDKSIKQ